MKTKSNVLFYEFLITLVFMAVFTLTWAVWGFGFLQHQAFAFLAIGLGIIVAIRSRHRIFDEDPGEGHWYVLIVLGLIVLAIPYLFHFAIIHDVATDEGRLFYDSSLLLEGMTPYEDFHTRSPLLIYGMAASQWLFGPTVIAGRLISILSMLISGFLLYLVGKELYSKRAGLIAASIFLFYPFVWLFVLGKTQPLQTVFVLLFFYLLILSLKKEGVSYLFLAGIALGLAFLVRESSAIYLVTLPILFLYASDLRPAIVKTACIAIPFAIVIGISVLAFGSLGTGVTSVAEGKLIQMSMDEMGVHFELGILLILVFVPFTIALLIGNLALGRIDPLKLMLPFWCGSLFLFYAWYAIMSKFHEQYWMEFFPVFALAIAVAMIFFLKIPGIRVTLVALTFVAIFIMLSNVAWIKLMEDPPRYTIDAVNDVTEFLEMTTESGDIIFCGSPIWAYTSQTHNAGRMSHYTDDQLKAIEDDFRAGRVKYIIMDGYTEKVIEESEYIQDQYENHYEEITRMTRGSYWEVRILGQKNE